MLQLLTLTEVAATLGVRRQTLRGWWEKGLFPRPVKIGRTIRFRQEEVEAALKSPAASN